MIMKTCTKCQKTKPVDDFYRHPRNSDGRSGPCIDCSKKFAREHRQRHPDRVRDSELKRRYGIIQAEFDEILDRQGGMCAICGTTEPNRLGWVVDHDHTTGRVRGILCATCNSGIGLLGDDPEVIAAALDYLRLPF